LNRIVSWFSCGAASAVATKLAIADGDPVTVAYCEVIEEHPDTVCKVEKTVNGSRTLERIPLRELPEDQGCYPNELEIQCGIFCSMAEQDYN